MRRDLVGGAVGLAFAAVYYRAADALPTSLLSDAVGADGLPKLLAAILAMLSGLLLLRPVAFGRLTAGGGKTEPMAVHGWALGLVGLALLYMWAAPWIGYPLALAALIAATAVYFGGRPNLHLAATAAGGAVVLWVLFAKLLGVAMPAGLWPRLVG